MSGPVVVTWEEEATGPLQRWAVLAGIPPGKARENWLRGKEARLRKFVQDEPPRLTGSRRSSS